MDASGSVTKFFYNIVPGSLFIFALSAIFNYPIPKENTVFMFFIFLCLSLLMGFIFQGLTKIDRKYPFKKNDSPDCLNKLAFCLNKISMKIFKHSIRNLNDDIWDSVEEKNKLNHKIAEEILDNQGIKHQSKEDIFYIMHDYLMANGKDKRTDFYMDRVAFWANIYYGSLILIVVSLIFQKWAVFVTLYIYARFFCRWLYHEYLRNLYDVVLKTFVVIASKKTGKIE